jgi:diacyltrehalose acyltransferase
MNRTIPLALAAAALSVGLAVPPVLAQTTVYTLEGSLNFFEPNAPKQLQGQLCPCTHLTYPNLPAGQFTAQGVQIVVDKVAVTEGDIVLMGHSQGGHVVYGVLRHWQENPDDAPDPATVTWVSVGNPQHPYSHNTTSWTLIGYDRSSGFLPTDTP